MKLTVLGPGCWGLTLAWLLNDNFDDVLDMKHPKTIEVLKREIKNDWHI